MISYDEIVTLGTVYPPPATPHDAARIEGAVKAAEAAGLPVTMKLSHNSNGTLFSATLVTKVYVRRIFCPHGCYGTHGMKVVPVKGTELPPCDECGTTTVNDLPQETTTP